MLKTVAGAVIGTAPPSWRAQATVTVDQAAAILGISRNTAYQAVHAKQLPSIRLGKRLLIPVAALRRLVDGEGAR